MPLEMLHHIRMELSSVSYCNYTHVPYIFILLMHLDTFDVENISAKVVDEYAIDIECHFIHGSDALGCKVVLVSDHSNVNNAEANFLKINISVFERLNLTHEALCYHHMFAYNIDVNSTVNTFYIEGEVILLTTANYVCSGRCIYLA